MCCLNHSQISGGEAVLIDLTCPGARSGVRLPRSKKSSSPEKTLGAAFGKKRKISREEAHKYPLQSPADTVFQAVVTPWGWDLVLEGKPLCHPGPIFGHRTCSLEVCALIPALPPLAEMISCVGLGLLLRKAWVQMVANTQWRVEIKSSWKLSLLNLTYQFCRCLPFPSQTSQELSPLPPYTLKVNSLKISLKLKKNFCLCSFHVFFSLALLAGGGGVFILWKLEEAKQFCLLWWVGVYLCVCSFLSMCLSSLSLSYLWMVPVCCPLLSVVRREKKKADLFFFLPFGFKRMLSFRC